MEFTVPQFIEYEAKVIGPFTFKQFIVVAGAGIVCVILYLKLPLYASLPLSAIIGGGALGLAFLKMEGRPPLVVLKNLIFFRASPKIYLWKRKVISSKVIKEEKEEIIKEEEPTLRIAKKSKLGKLISKVETGKEQHG